jgi:organic hydroperoxide reductase OsmC/OhrA
VIITTYPEAVVTENEWNAEHLFLSAVTTSFLSTYIDLAKKMKFENAGFECTATGQVELVDGKFKFTFIHIYPKAYVMNDGEIEKAQLALVRAKKTCPIFNSINSEIVLHPEVAINQNTDSSFKKH